MKTVLANNDKDIVIYTETCKGGCGGCQGCGR